MAIYKNLIEMIGSTPMVQLDRLGVFYSCFGTIYAKCEYLNPSGSVKDRMAFEIIRRAVMSGALSRDGYVICLSGGNGGISAAMVCAAVGVKCMIVAPSSIALSDLRHMRAYGARVQIVPGANSLEDIESRARELLAQNAGSILLDQFNDPINTEAHKHSAGAEILNDVPDIDYLVAGIGTGGTISGIAEYIKMHRPDCTIIGVEPSESPVLSGGMAGPHGLTGIGVGFKPPILNEFILDMIVRVHTPEALAVSKQLALTEGMLCGPSSGAALAAAIAYAQKQELHGKKIVAILPDRGERYLEREIYNGE